MDLLLTSIGLAEMCHDKHQDVGFCESKIDEDEVRERAVTNKVYRDCLLTIVIGI